MIFFFSVLFFYGLFLLISLLPLALSAFRLSWISLLGKSLNNFYEFSLRRGKIHYLLPFLFTYYYIFVYAYYERKWVYDLALLLSLLSRLWSQLVAIFLLRYLVVFGFTLPISYHYSWIFPLLGLILSFFRLWISLSLSLYRTSTLWNYHLVASLFQDFLLLSGERPLIRTFLNLSFNSSYHHLPPPHLPKPPADVWSRTQIIGGLALGTLGLTLSGGIFYYARQQALAAEAQALAAEAQALATQELAREKARKNDLTELSRGILSPEEYKLRRQGDGPRDKETP